MSDMFDEQAEAYKQAAKELKLAAKHLRTTARHFKNREIPGACAHILATQGHLLSVQKNHRTSCDHSRL